MGLTLWEDTARTTLNQGLHAGIADKRVKSGKATYRKASRSETSEQKPEQSTELLRRRQNSSPGLRTTCELSKTGQQRHREHERAQEEPDVWRRPRRRKGGGGRAEGSGNNLRSHWGAKDGQEPNPIQVLE